MFSATPETSDGSHGGVSVYGTVCTERRDRATKECKKQGGQCS